MGLALGILSVLAAAVFAACGNPWMKDAVGPLYKDKDGGGWSPPPVPANTTDNNWGNAFRGRGWNGSTYQGGAVNSHITLVYQNP